jgi:putative FmdB family regulatory protein
VPIYEYICYRCDERCEEYRRIGDYTPPECCQCSTMMERIISAPSLSVWDASRRFPNLSPNGDGTMTFRTRMAYENHLKEHGIVEVSQGGDRIKRPHGNKVLRTA